jgi:ribonuclease-3
MVIMTEHPVEDILQYQFINCDLLSEALLAAGASVSNKGIQGNAKGNKRLALLGDSVLQEAVLEPWYSSGESTGRCTRLSICWKRLTLPEEGSNKVKKLCRNKKLSQVAQESGLVKYIENNPCQKGQISQETAASTVEALVGAVFLDCGKNMTTVKEVLKAISLFQDS